MPTASAWTSAAFGALPPTLTIWDTAAYVGSQVFMLIGTTLLLPMVLGYTVFVFWVFRGKLKPGEGYH